MQENIKEQNFKMKHLIKVLHQLELNSAISLIQYLNSCFTYESKVFAELEEATKKELLKTNTYVDSDMVSILADYNQVKYYQFVIACLMATQNIDAETAADLIDNGSNLLKLGTSFQNQIMALQSIATEPATPNDTATN